MCTHAKDSIKMVASDFIDGLSGMLVRLLLFAAGVAVGQRIYSSRKANIFEDKHTITEGAKIVHHSQLR